MGVAYKEERKTKKRPKYPDAPEKVAYYENIINQLNTYKNKAESAKNSMKRETYSASVENPDAKGPYYDEYLTHKGYWFGQNAMLVSGMEGYIDLIEEKINDAMVLKRSWEAKALEMEEYEVVVYVPVYEEDN